jgi:hypothetical protein
MLKFAQLRSTLLLVGSVVTAAQPAIAEDLIDVLSAGVPDEVLGIFFPETFRAGGGAFLGTTVQDDAYGAALFSLGPTIDTLADGIFSEVKNLPVAPGVAAFIYELDPETNQYKRTGDGLGAIYSDRAQTLGKGRLNFGVAWSHIEYDEYEDTSLRNLPIEASPNQAVIVTSNETSLTPTNNGHLSILYPDDHPNGESFPDAGVTWTLPDDNTTGTAPCAVQGGNTCSGTIPGTGYHFQSFGPIGDYMTTSGVSSSINLNLHLDVELINVYLAYGVTDRFDIGLVMPFMETDVGVDVDVSTPFIPANANFANNPSLYPGSAAVCMGDSQCLFDEFLLAHEEKYNDLNTFGTDPCYRACPSTRAVRADAYTNLMRDEFFLKNRVRTTYSSWGEDGGIGDLLIRGKYRFLDSRYIDMAGRLDVSFPTGSKDNFRGTGEYMGAANLIASKTIGWFAPHVNLGVQLRTGGKENHQFRWAVGADARVHRIVTMSFDFIGSEDLHHDGIGDTEMALAPGVKVNPWKNFLVAAGVLIQVNHQGLRTDVIPTLGVEYTFF